MMEMLRYSCPSHYIFKIDELIEHKMKMCLLNLYNNKNEAWKVWHKALHFSDGICFSCGVEHNVRHFYLPITRLHWGYIIRELLLMNWGSHNVWFTLNPWEVDAHIQSPFSVSHGSFTQCLIFVIVMKSWCGGMGWVWTPYLLFHFQDDSDLLINQQG